MTPDFLSAAAEALFLSTPEPVSATCTCCEEELDVDCAEDVTHCLCCKEVTCLNCAQRVSQEGKKFFVLCDACDVEPDGDDEDEDEAKAEAHFMFYLNKAKEQAAKNK
jgi:hypothetical protein